jgi:PPOX class probable F420-dependent enzyme
MDLSYPVMKAMRSRQAAEAARQLATGVDFEELRNFRQAIVVTHRRSGAPMPTPINHAVSDDGKLYFRSEPHMGKMKRIRNNPRVGCARGLRRGGPGRAYRA